MRQAPQYLLIGNGRVARHFQYYFSLLNLPFNSWHRAESIDKLNIKLLNATHILLLINDHAIDQFISKHINHQAKLCIHFSGSLISQYAIGVHPLMTFSHQLYTLEQYQAIPFILDQKEISFHTLFPALSNSFYFISTEHKAKYHALCVLSGNLSCILWNKFFKSLENEFSLPATVGHEYLKQQTLNLLDDYRTALTGPLLRNDVSTIDSNITALTGDIFQKIYQCFAASYQEIKQDLFA